MSPPKLHPPSGKPSLLEQLAGALDVDADTMDWEFIATLPITPHDMTSNPNFVHQALVDPRNAELVRATVKEMKGEAWKDVYARCIARMAKNVQPYISGRVLAQTSPKTAYDEEAQYADAKRLGAALNAEGFSNDKYCIKMAGTGPAMRAAKRLSAEGVPTLCTALFSLPQAIAAAQAGCHAVSMYYNVPSSHSDPASWPDVEDPATQHPMSARHYQIRQTYDRLAKEEGKKVPQMKTASFVSVRELMAMPELGADHITVGLGALRDLATTDSLLSYTNAKGQHNRPMSEWLGQAQPNPFVWDKWTPPGTGTGADKTRLEALAKTDPAAKAGGAAFKLASTDVDWLEGDTLDKYIEGDEVTRVYLKMANEAFGRMETESETFIKGLQKEYE